MVCSGKEERLADCFFPENFGVSDADYDPAADESTPASGLGISNRDCNTNGSAHWGVICRRFEITGATRAKKTVRESVGNVRKACKYTMSCMHANMHDTKHLELHWGQCYCNSIRHQKYSTLNEL